MVRRIRIAVLLFSALAVTTVGAASLLELSVGAKAKRYQVRSKAILAAPVEAVYDTLIDFDEYEKFSSVYKDARWIHRDEQDSGEMYTYTRGCILFFCKGFERYESVESVVNESIITRVLPEKSDVKFGYSEWKLEAAEESTVIYFDLDFEPDFWVPPVVGPFVVKRMLRKNSVDALNRIEVLAKARVENSDQ